MGDKQILPHQEITELVNLGTYYDKKEVKIGSSLDSFAKEEIIVLFWNMQIYSPGPIKICRG